jgi:hypothetical protein
LISTEFVDEATLLWRECEEVEVVVFFSVVSRLPASDDELLGPLPPPPKREASWVLADDSSSDPELLARSPLVPDTTSSSVF